ncbi:MAG: hypothetical protein GOMPHAMPRED_000190 [Gomphillus americanus]|uniref:BZIP domain-containing protein n=1 Tax=Gomphillus americanus TaxID=1940652 RepID=A0A8H3I3M4_9LECA|nr:MAG: hypothetical protein GOMPHAMPRED_000190 [Gomphillus americanus]
MASRALAQKPDNDTITTPVEALSPTEGPSPLTKQYVIPPRPKPGRKPATDTPPTRRKAQNRAAQRAFRERRAAKVNELEDELNEMRKEHEAELAQLRRESDLRLRDANLFHRSSAQSLANEIAALREKSTTLEAMLSGSRTGTISDEEAQRSYQTPPAIQDGCGNCTTDSRCQCVEDAFEVNVAAEQKRPPSPHLIPETAKRQRTFQPEELEIDFTTLTAPVLPSVRKLSISTSQIEPCGFCSDGRACICAEIAADHTQPAIVETKIADPSPIDGNSSCENGPGSCGTCKTNPTVSIMCQALNASQSPEMRYRSPKPPDPAPCALGEACCRVSSTIAEARAQDNGTDGGSNQLIRGPTLSCADAFETLSQHKAFDQASQELGTWLPMLKTVPTRPHNQNERPGEEESLPIQAQAVDASQSISTTIAGMTGFEIEAASVLSVLSFYERKYGTDRP